MFKNRFASRRKLGCAVGDVSPTRTLVLNGPRFQLYSWILGTPRNDGELRDPHVVNPSGSSTRDLLL
jgi:hypothetical protein